MSKLVNYMKVEDFIYYNFFNDRDLYYFLCKSISSRLFFKFMNEENEEFIKLRIAELINLYLFKILCENLFT